MLFFLLYELSTFIGNDRYSVPKTPDDAILFPVSGMNVIEAN